ncbi:metallophosphoesterase family protein [Planctomycetota bacterium]
MRYGILGDIHGNLEALDTVLERLAQEKPDRYFCLGDLVGYGTDPSTCIKKVRELNCPIVAGNHDFAAAGVIDTDFFNIAARNAIYWTTKHLTNQDKEFLRHLKLIEKVPESNNTSIMFTHSSPYQPELFEYIQTDYDLWMGFNNQETQLCFIGHSHIPTGFVLNNGETKDKATVSLINSFNFKVEPNQKLIINAGSVGQPRDEDPRACYAVYDDATKEIHIERVEYDIEKAGSKIIRSGLPASLAERLKHGR